MSRIRVSAAERKRRGRSLRQLTGDQATTPPPGGFADDARPVFRLADGTVGYGMAPDRTDDCLRAALATLLQVPPEQIPDPRLDERLERGDDPADISRETWERLDMWLASRGLCAVVHTTLPVTLDRWLGVIPRRPPDEEWHPGVVALARAGLYGVIEVNPNGFNDHTVVLSGDRIIFDPVISVRPPGGLMIHPSRPSEVAWGLSVHAKE